jgi:hypothetical protein
MREWPCRVAGKSTESQEERAKVDELSRSSLFFPSPSFCVLQMLSRSSRLSSLLTRSFSTSIRMSASIPVPQDFVRPALLPPTPPFPPRFIAPPLAHGLRADHDLHALLAQNKGLYTSLAQEDPEIQALVEREVSYFVSLV